MARLSTKALLVAYIRSQLGEPTITLDVSDTQIGEIIDDTIQKFTEYAYGTLEATALVELTGIGEYQMQDTMTNVISVTQGSTSNLTNFSSNFGAGYVPDLWSQQFFSSSPTGDIVPAVIAISNTKAILDKYFGSDIVYNFNHLNKVLHVMQDVTGTVLVHFQYEYIANDLGPDYVFNHEWVKNYSKAKTKELWSVVTGKFSQTLVGGATINYDKMASEADGEIQKLDEELLNRWSDPAPIMIG